MIDIAIITVLFEEYDAAMNILESPEAPVLSQDNPLLFGWRLGYVSSARYGSPYSVVVAQCSEQTQVPSAMATLLTVQQFQPRYVIFCGIAGGINPGQLIPKKERLAQFDVLIASVIWGYEYGKVEGGFKPRMDLTYRADPVLKQAAELFGKSDTSWVTAARTDFREMGIDPGDAPKVISGPVASGDKVIDKLSSKFFKAVLKQWPKLRGIEMEGAGAAAAVELMNSQGINSRYLMIRAISDMPPSKGEDPSTTVGVSQRDLGKTGAAKVAATFIRGLIRRAWPLPPLGETDDPGSGPTGSTDGPRGGTSLVRSEIRNSCQERVIFYMADRELHNNSGILWARHNRDEFYNRLLLEFRLIFLSMNTDGTIVIPPTYFLETPPLRDLITSHMRLLELGYVKLLLNSPSLGDYLEQKKHRYQKAARFANYFDAYFANATFYGLHDLPFQLTAKSKSIGLRTHASWRRAVLGRAQHHPKVIIKTHRFLELADRTEKSAILYENLHEHQRAAGLSDAEAFQLDYRATMNRYYLLNYLHLGFTVPEASSLVWDGITWHLPLSGLHLVALGRMVEELCLKERILKADTLTLLMWRSREPVRILFTLARQLLRDGRSITQVVLDMLKAPWPHKLNEAFS